MKNKIKRIHFIGIGGSGMSGIAEVMQTLGFTVSGSDLAISDTIKSLKKADGLVVGSAICKEITNSINRRQNAVTNVTSMVKKLKNKIR